MTLKKLGLILITALSLIFAITYLPFYQSYQAKKFLSEEGLGVAVLESISPDYHRFGLKQPRSLEWYLTHCESYIVAEETGNICHYELKDARSSCIVMRSPDEMKYSKACEGRG